MSSTRTLLRGAVALLGDELSFDALPRDVLVEHGRITAIEAAGSISTARADALIELPRCLLAPGLVNGHRLARTLSRGRTRPAAGAVAAPGRGRMP